MSRCSAWPALALLVSVSTLAACGQKGPLYMPSPPAAKAPAPAAADDKTNPAEPAKPAR